MDPLGCVWRPFMLLVIVRLQQRSPLPPFGDARAIRAPQLRCGFRLGVPNDARVPGVNCPGCRAGHTRTRCMSTRSGGQRLNVDATYWRAVPARYAQWLHVSFQNKRRMPDTFSLTVHRGSYLLLVASGVATLGDLRSLLELTATVTKKEHYGRALVDMMSVEFLHRDKEDRGLGHQAARSLQHLSRVAFAVCGTFRQESGAQIARQSGLDLQIFESLPEASEWISAARATVYLTSAGACSPETRDCSRAPLLAPQYPASGLRADSPSSTKADGVAR
jgi:hypothetical protein